MGGALYYIEEHQLASWKKDVEAFGFTIEEIPRDSSGPEEHLFVFVGKLKDASGERWIEIQRDGSGFLMAIRYRRRSDAELFAKTIGTKFPPPPWVRSR